MRINEKLKQIFSPLDLLVVEKEYQYLFPVDKVPDLPGNLFDDVKMFLSCGEYWDRNPAVWRVFAGASPATDSEEWKRGMLNYFRSVCKPKIVPLDEDRHHITMTADFEILVINARELPENAFEGAKCAIVKTLFGEFQISPEETENTE